MRWVSAPAECLQCFGRAYCCAGSWLFRESKNCWFFRNFLSLRKRDGMAFSWTFEKETIESQDAKLANRKVWRFNNLWSLPKKTLQCTNGVFIANTRITAECETWTDANWWKNLNDIHRFRGTIIPQNVRFHLCVSRKLKPNKHSSSETSTTKNVWRSVMDEICKPTSTSHF